MIQIDEHAAHRILRWYASVSRGSARGSLRANASGDDACMVLTIARKISATPASWCVVCGHYRMSILAIWCRVQAAENEALDRLEALQHERRTTRSAARLDDLDELIEAQKQRLVAVHNTLDDVEAHGNKMFSRALEWFCWFLSAEISRASQAERNAWCRRWHLEESES